MKEAASPAGLVADFYKGLIAQDVPQDVAIALTTEWIKAMMGFAKDQSKQADVLAQWLASQKIINRG
jgi:hypothetical protein